MQIDNRPFGPLQFHLKLYVNPQNVLKHLLMSCVYLHSSISHGAVQVVVVDVPEVTVGTGVVVPASTLLDPQYV